MSEYSVSITNDTLFDGRLICRQHKHGYRFSVDAVLVAHFLSPDPSDKILDLGCGSGVIGLIAAFRHQGVSLVGIEVQNELYNLAGENIISNGLAERCSVKSGSYRHVSALLEPESFDQVVSNPPYRQQGRGKVNPDDQKARARHEIDSTLSDVVRAAAFAVRNRGRVVMVYPAQRSVALITEFKKFRLEPKRIQPVYSYPGSPGASLVLIEAIKNGGEELHLLPPFYIYTEKNGSYTDEMQQLYI